MADKPDFVAQRFGIAGAPSEALVRVPARGVRGGLVALHPASDGRAEQPLFTHLAMTLAPLGVAVLTYDRRQPIAGAAETALDVQTSDAMSAVEALQSRFGVPCGLFGFSQGAWAAVDAAARSATAWLVLVGWSAVSPADQMRFHTDEVLRRRGFADEDRALALRLRVQFEGFIRSGEGREALADALDECSGREWFRHAYLPSEPPVLPTWRDMDHDATAAIVDVRCPVLAIWGAEEDCSPPRPGMDVLETAGSSDISTVLLAGCGHVPKRVSVGADQGVNDGDQFDLDYTLALRNWFAERLGRLADEHRL